MIYDLPHSRTHLMKPITLRIWHWMNAIAILGLLGTVLLRKTFLSWRTNSAIIQEKITSAGGQIDAGLAKEIASTVRDRMWEWHYIFGFTLAALYIFRFFVLFRNRETRPVFSNLKLHHKLVQFGYIAFYAMTLVMIGSGFLMYFKDSLGLAKDTVTYIKENHETAMWFFAVFTGAHIAGVFIAENRDEPGIVSRMINGRDGKY